MEEDKDSDSLSKEKSIGAAFNKLAQNQKKFKYKRIDTKIIDNDENFHFGKNFEKIEDSDNSKRKRASGSKNSKIEGEIQEETQAVLKSKKFF